LPDELRVKVRVEIDLANGEYEIESMWAVVEERGYRLDNIPFYARSLAWGDVVSAEPDADGLLRFTGVVAASGHSTIRLWFENTEPLKAVRDELRAMGCDSELDHIRLVAVDVPPDVPYYPRIKDYLDAKERAGVFEYEEGCLAHAR
jgi:hypothetical protein